MTNLGHGVQYPLKLLQIEHDFLLQNNWFKNVENSVAQHAQVIFQGRITLWGALHQHRKYPAMLVDKWLIHEYFGPGNNSQANKKMIFLILSAVMFYCVQHHLQLMKKDMPVPDAGFSLKIVVFTVVLPSFTHKKISKNVFKRVNIPSPISSKSYRSNHLLPSDGWCKTTNTVSWLNPVYYIVYSYNHVLR